MVSQSGNRIPGGDTPPPRRPEPPIVVLQLPAELSRQMISRAKEALHEPGQVFRVVRKPSPAWLAVEQTGNVLVGHGPFDSEAAASEEHPNARIVKVRG